MTACSFNFRILNDKSGPKWTVLKDGSERSVTTNFRFQDCSLSQTEILDFPNRSIWSFYRLAKRIIASLLVV